MSGSGRSPPVRPQRGERDRAPGGLVKVTGRASPALAPGRAGPRTPGSYARPRRPPASERPGASEGGFLEEAAGAGSRPAPSRSPAWPSQAGAAGTRPSAAAGAPRRPVPARARARSHGEARPPSLTPDPSSEIAPTWAGARPGLQGSSAPPPSALGTFFWVEGPPRTPRRARGKPGRRSPVQPVGEWARDPRGGCVSVSPASPRAFAADTPNALRTAGGPLRLGCRGETPTVPQRCRAGGNWRRGERLSPVPARAAAAPSQAGSSFSPGAAGAPAAGFASFCPASPLRLPLPGGD